MALSFSLFAWLQTSARRAANKFCFKWRVGHRRTGTVGSGMSDLAPVAVPRGIMNLFASLADACSSCAPHYSINVGP